jgi:hypothetical protein
VLQLFPAVGDYQSPKLPSLDYFIGFLSGARIIAIKALLLHSDQSTYF